MTNQNKFIKFSSLITLFLTLGLTQNLSARNLYRMLEPALGKQVEGLQMQIEGLQDEYEREVLLAAEATTDFKSEISAMRERLDSLKARHENVTEKRKQAKAGRAAGKATSGYIPRRSQTSGD